MTGMSKTGGFFFDTTPTHRAWDDNLEKSLEEEPANDHAKGLQVDERLPGRERWQAQRRALLLVAEEVQRIDGDGQADGHKRRTWRWGW